MQTANTIKVGNIILFNGRMCYVVSRMHTQPGKGGAYVQMQLRDIVENTKLVHRFRSDEKVERIIITEEPYQFLYYDGQYIFMNNTTFEQKSLTDNEVPEEVKALLKPDMIVSLQLHDDAVIGVLLPKHIEVTIEETEVTMKGQTVTASYKPAQVTGGVTIAVPPFLNIGDRIIIDSETMSYVERVKE